MYALRYQYQTASGAGRTLLGDGESGADPDRREDVSGMVRCDRTESVCGRRDLVLEKEEKKKRININEGDKNADSIC